MQKGCKKDDDFLVDSIERPRNELNALYEKIFRRFYTHGRRDGSLAAEHVCSLSGRQEVLQNSQTTLSGVLVLRQKRPPSETTIEFSETTAAYVKSISAYSRVWL